MKTRCKWCQDNGVNQKYHDEEWGIPVHDDRKHFEFLMMEVMQCGLNWTMMLNKRDIFRQCFDHFDYEKIIRYDEQKIQEIMETPGMIRSPRKIKAVITNAIAYMEIIKEYGSFDQFLWSYTDGKTMVYKKMCIRDRFYPSGAGETGAGVFRRQRGDSAEGEWGVQSSYG